MSILAFLHLLHTAHLILTGAHSVMNTGRVIWIAPTPALSAATTRDRDEESTHRHRPKVWLPPNLANFEQKSLSTGSVLGQFKSTLADSSETHAQKNHPEHIEGVLATNTIGNGIQKYLHHQRCFSISHSRPTYHGNHLTQALKSTPKSGVIRIQSIDSCSIWKANLADKISSERSEYKVPRTGQNLDWQ